MRSCQEEEGERISWRQKVLDNDDNDFFFVYNNLAKGRDTLIAYKQYRYVPKIIYSYRQIIQWEH